MKILLLCACLLTAPGGDREKGLQHYREGRYAEAAAAFRAAIESEGDSADLQFNLALACWRAGDLAAAETAVEKYAAMAGDARIELHAGLLGALRHEEAKVLEARADALLAGSGQPALAPNVAPNGAPNAAPNPAPEDPMPLLEQALKKAVQSQDYFLRGVKAKPAPELLRNVERSLRTIDEIEKKIEELKKQRKEQEDDKKDGEKKPDDENEHENEKKDGDKKPDEKSEPDDEKKQDEKKPDEKQNEKQDEKQQPEGKGEEKPEPKPEPQEQKGDERKPEPKADEAKSGEKPPSEQPEPKPGEEQKPRTDAPGEAAEGKELTPEQTQRLMEQLQDLDAKLKSFRARAKSGRRPVERDW